MNRIAVLGMLVVAGCSSTYDREWEEQGKRLGAPAPGAVESRWSGMWHSDVNGHQGTLRCIISPRSDSGYDARYYATFGWFCFQFAFEYSLPMTVDRDDGGWRFRGSAVLDYWIAGGPYRYEGRMDEEDFTASYDAGFDRGIFRMKRVR